MIKYPCREDGTHCRSMSDRHGVERRRNLLRCTSARTRAATPPTPVKEIFLPIQASDDASNRPSEVGSCPQEKTSGLSPYGVYKSPRCVRCVFCHMLPSTSKVSARSFDFILRESAVSAQLLPHEHFVDHQANVLLVHVIRKQAAIL